MPNSMRKSLSSDKRLVIGVTGGIGCGKSTVARFFQQLGAHCIDADQIARRILSGRNSISRRIIACFGKDIVNSDGNIDRQRLAELVFSDKNKLLKLNRIIHPAVIQMIKKEICQNSSSVIVLDAPLLIEAGISSLVDILIVVRLAQRLALSRKQDQSGLSRQHLLKRIKAQLPLKRKIPLADFVIDNSGTKSDTRKQVMRIWQLLKKEKSALMGQR